MLNVTIENNFVTGKKHRSDAIVTDECMEIMPGVDKKGLLNCNYTHTPSTHLPHIVLLKYRCDESHKRVKITGHIFNSIC